MTFQEELRKNDWSACKPVLDWVGNKSKQQAWKECPRGDWMVCWLNKQKNLDKRRLTLAFAQCANLVSHLMTDRRCEKAVKTALAFGRGEADEKEFVEIATEIATDDIFDAPGNFAANAAAIAAATINTRYAYNVGTLVANAVDGVTARKKVLSKCAEIIRKIFPIAP